MSEPETNAVHPAQGSDAAQVTTLIEANLDLVNHIVFQVAVAFPRHVDRDELARAGALGLVEAARRYDDDKGVPFQRFAAQRIRGAIIDAVRSADWAPRSVRALARELDGTEQRLASRLGRRPDQREVAEALDMSRADLHRLQDRIFRSVVLALEPAVSDNSDDELTVVDLLADDRAVEPSTELERRELHAYLRDAVALLPERQRLVIIGYFVEERSSSELARFLGVTESRVSQIRTDALEALRRGIEAQYIPAPGEAASGRREQRRVNYAADISQRQEWRERISLLERVERRPVVLAR